MQRRHTDAIQLHVSNGKGPFLIRNNFPGHIHPGAPLYPRKGAPIRITNVRGVFHWNAADNSTITIYGTYLVTPEEMPSMQENFEASGWQVIEYENRDTHPKLAHALARLAEYPPNK